MRDAMVLRTLIWLERLRRVSAEAIELEHVRLPAYADWLAVIRNALTELDGTKQRLAAAEQEREDMRTRWEVGTRSIADLHGKIGTLAHERDALVQRVRELAQNYQGMTAGAILHDLKQRLTEIAIERDSARRQAAELAASGAERVRQLEQVVADSNRIAAERDALVQRVRELEEMWARGHEMCRPEVDAALARAEAAEQRAEHVTMLLEDAVPFVADRAEGGYEPAMEWLLDAHDYGLVNAFMRPKTPASQPQPADAPAGP